MAGKVDLKVVLLGKEFGGKTSLVERYIHGKFNAQAPYQSVSWRETGSVPVVCVCGGIWTWCGPMGGVTGSSVCCWCPVVPSTVVAEEDGV